MALGLPAVTVLLLGVSLSTCVLAQSDDCKSYNDYSGVHHSSKTCYGYIHFCCGTCTNRYCCSDPSRQISEDTQDDCEDRWVSKSTSPVSMIVGIVGSIVTLLIFICCCVCPCCCLYKMCRKPQPVIATTTHTTVVTTTPRQYPQQPTAAPGPSPQPYQGVQYPPYQPMPVQPGYGTQGMPAAPYQGQPFVPGPPPTYQEATGPAYPPQPMPYSQAAYGPGQPAYPMHPPTQPQPMPQPMPQPQPNVPPSQMDYLAQPAYNPDFVAPPFIK